jgi:hypothetical protein
MRSSESSLLAAVMVAGVTLEASRLASSDNHPFAFGTVVGLGEVHRFVFTP